MKTYRLDHLTPIQKTLLITLKGRALDSQSARPILRDPLAADLVRRLDDDLDTVKVSNTVVLAVAVRSIILDRAVRTFVDAHPDAVVVELGSGLETRQYRLDPPATVDWYDVDFPEVIQLRKELLPPRENAHPVGASLLEGDWTEKIPGDRPTILVADGVIGFLAEAANKKLLTSVTDHFASGELVFNAYAKFVARMIGRSLEPATRSVGLPKGHPTYGIGDPHDVVALNPRLTFVEEHTAYTHPDAEWINEQFTGLTRLAARWFAHWPAQARRGVWVMRYRF
jgi:O-methyltransferase involved in polyketide biosynthesis